VVKASFLSHQNIFTPHPNVAFTGEQRSCRVDKACVRLVAWLVPGRLLWAGSALTPQAPAAAEQPQPPAAEQGLGFGLPVPSKTEGSHPGALPKPPEDTGSRSRRPGG